MSLMTTPHRGNRYPSLDRLDAADVPLWLSRLASDLDTAPIDGQGILTLRPPQPTMFGTYYTTTDEAADTGKTRRTYRSNGASYDEIPLLPITERMLSLTTLTLGADATLARTAANELTANQTLRAYRNITGAAGDAGQVRIGGYGTGVASAVFGLAGDTSLYRSAAAWLRVTDNLEATSRIVAFTGAAGQIDLNNATINLGLAGNQANIYRLSNAALKTDGEFQAGQDVHARVSATTWVALGARGPASEAAVAFGPTLAEKIYRSGAGALKTGATWWSAYLYSDAEVYGRVNGAQQVKIGYVGGNAGITLGSAEDTQLVRLKAGALGTQQAPIGATTVTSLPVAPVDQQECYFLADATNGIIWRMRYRSGSASAYKWEIVGNATPLRADTDTTEAASSGGAANTWNNLVTPCSLVAPLAGEYEVGWQASINFPGAAATTYGWVVPNIYQDNTGLIITGSAQNADGLYVHINRTRKATLTAGQTVNLQSRWSNGGHNNAYKTLTLRPSRVG